MKIIKKQVEFHCEECGDSFSELVEYASHENVPEYKLCESCAIKFILSFKDIMLILPPFDWLIAPAEYLCSSCEFFKLDYNISEWEKAESGFKKNVICPDCEGFICLMCGRPSEIPEWYDEQCLEKVQTKECTKPFMERSGYTLEDYIREDSERYLPHNIEFVSN